MYASRGQYERWGLVVVEGVSPLDYALSQPGVILHYLQTAIWPSGLALDSRSPDG